MIYSVRNKLALSHILPILLVMPLLILYLLFTLEDFFTQNLLRQLNYQAALASQLVLREPSSLTSEITAHRVLSEIAGLTDARVLLLNGDGVILASTRSEDRDRLGRLYDQPSITQALMGNRTQGVGPGFFSEVAYVVLPLRLNETVVGALRVSYDVADLRAEFNQLLVLVLGGVMLTALLALGLGLGLATTITRPLSELAKSARLITQGNYGVRAPFPRRDEVGSLARSFNEMAARLGELEQARHRQLAAITHELARPLTGMRAAIETLQDGADAETEARALLLSGVLEELARMQRLIESLQHIQKRMLRPMELHREAVALDRVLRSMLANYDALAAQSGVILEAELPRNIPRVFADQDRLIQVLTNLLDNAFKFTPPGGRVTVLLGENGECTWVTIADTGVGIASDELPNLFQEFYQGGSLHPAEKRGMGLGLTITREIIRAHAGTIGVESEPGCGTRVTFTLPKSPAVDE